MSRQAITDYERELAAAWVAASRRWHAVMEQELRSQSRRSQLQMAAHFWRSDATNGNIWHN
eukprot:6629503-Pyramimonas_sp.AAC.1